MQGVTDVLYKVMIAAATKCNSTVSGLGRNETVSANYFLKLLASLRNSLLNSLELFERAECNGLFTLHNSLA